MEVRSAFNESSNISTQKLVSFVREVITGVSGYEDPEHPSTPGPWDPYIRRALLRLSLILGPTPEPWRTIFGPGPQPWTSVFGPVPDPWIEVVLNPQPLPPKAAFAASLAEEVIDRAVLMQEIANAFPQADDQQGISIVGGLFSRFIDDCGNDRVWKKRPFPPRHDERDDKLSAVELITMGAVFDARARTVVNIQLQNQFRDAGARLTEMGFARM
ncbi:MAG TPA: hypothetical protein VKM94_18345 [Blastocatellia bacterium]|nr:hypothetical protein [Blastocatellia bacterium]